MGTDYLRSRDEQGVIVKVKVIIKDRVIVIFILRFIAIFIVGFIVIFIIIPGVPVYLRPLISLSSEQEMNLWISSFKNINSKISRIFVYRDIKGMRHYSRLLGYS